MPDYESATYPEVMSYKPEKRTHLREALAILMFFLAVAAILSVWVLIV